MPTVFVFLHKKNSQNIKKFATGKNRASFFDNFLLCESLKPLAHKAFRRFCVKTQKIFLAFHNMVIWQKCIKALKNRQKRWNFNTFLILARLYFLICEA